MALKQLEISSPADGRNKGDFPLMVLTIHYDEQDAATAESFAIVARALCAVAVEHGVQSLRYNLDRLKAAIEAEEREVAR